MLLLSHLVLSYTCDKLLTTFENLECCENDSGKLFSQYSELFESFETVTSNIFISLRGCPVPQIGTCPNFAELKENDPSIDVGFLDYVRELITLNDLTTDNLVLSWGDEGIEEIVTMNGIDVYNPFIKGMWNRLWILTELSGKFLNGTPASKDTSLLRSVRLVYVFSLLNALDLFGTFFTDPYTKIQIQSQELFSFLEYELKNMISHPMSLGSSDLYKDYIHVGPHVDRALLGKLYLNAERYTDASHWEDAIEQYESIVNSNIYRLHSNYSELFMANNHELEHELMFTIKNQGRYTPNYGSTTFLTHSQFPGMQKASFYGVNFGWNGFKSLSELTTKFSINDTRALFDKQGRKETVTDRTKEDEGFFFTKYRNIRRGTNEPGNDPNGNFVEVDFPIMRYSEILLSLSEAYMQTGNLNSSIKYLDMVRVRANMTEFSGNISLTHIYDERQREFYLEGHRRLDLIRAGVFASGTWSLKNSVSEDHNRFPVPFTPQTSSWTPNPGFYASPPSPPPSPPSPPQPPLTPIECVPTLSNWGLVGSTINNWGGSSARYASTKDIPLIKADIGTSLTYTTLFKTNDTELKARKYENWAQNVGFNPSTLSVVPNGDNLLVSGSKYVKMTLYNLKTYSIEDVSKTYGIIGDAVPNADWMSTNDFSMVPDPCGMPLRFYLFDIKLVPGTLKLREDKSWMNPNWGGVNGELSLNGENIAITEEGVYNLMFDLTLLKYNIQLSS